MLPIYENVANNLEVYRKKSNHIPPHIHRSLECVLVTKGTLELGIGKELYHMEQGDFGIVFPEQVHHYQVFTPNSRGIYVLAVPSLCEGFRQVLSASAPEVPVIPAAQVHAEIRYVLNSMLKEPHPKEEEMLHVAYMHLILARALPELSLKEKSTKGSEDIIYRTAAYITEHFRDSFTLSDMAHDLGVSPYTLSRVFSGSLHTNFNQYLNEVRLDYACNLLRYTDQSITDACMNAGFESQRTFNRVFKEELRMSPREYRAQYKKELLETGEAEASSEGIRDARA